MNLKWFREGGAWVLRRGYETDDGATLWQETGYVVTGEGTHYVKYPGKMSRFHTRLRDAKAEAERLARDG